ALIVYVLMAVTPAVPKRWFLPITLFTPLASLLFLPLMIYFYEVMPLVAWASSLLQLAVGLWILFRVRGARTMRWPLVPPEQLGTRGFTWRNLSLFVLGNLFVLLPGALVFLAFWMTVAVQHLSAGFMALHPSGITVQVRTYVRDGKTVEL